MTSTQARAPRTGDPVGVPIPDTTAEDLEVVAARADAAGVEYGALPVAVRARALRSMADSLAAAGTEIVATADAETGLGTPRLVGELNRVLHQLRMFATALDDGLLDAVVDPGVSGSADRPARPEMRRLLLPLGTVGVFLAGNFPLAFGVSGGDTASALAAGCPVIAKAHPGQPGTAELVCGHARAGLSRAGVPEDTLTVVHGVETGRRLVTHSRVKAVSFTGSLSGGRALFDLAVRRPDPIPFYGELGSLNPVVVLPTAARTRADEIADGFVASFTGSGGQLCTKPGLLMVPAGSPLLHRIAERVSAAPPAVLLSGAIDERFGAVSDSLSQACGVRVLARSARDTPRDGWWRQPMVLSTDTAHLAGVLEECFGPLAVIVTYDDIDDVVAALDEFGGQLATGLHG